MAEQNNFDVNNLSIPEEAFELFQSSSMYSDDELAALAGSACLQPVTVDSTNTLDKMLSENEIVSSTNTDDQPQMSYLNLEVGSEVNIAEGVDHDVTPSLEINSEANTDFGYQENTNDFVQESIIAPGDTDGDLNVEYVDNTVMNDTLDMETVSNSDVNDSPEPRGIRRGRGRGRGRGKGRGRGRGWGRGKSRGGGRKSFKEQIDPDAKLITNGNTENSDKLSSLVSCEEVVTSECNNMQPILGEKRELVEQTTDSPLEEVTSARKRGRKKKINSLNDSTALKTAGDNPPQKVSCRRGRSKKGASIQVTTPEKPLTVSGDMSGDINDSQKIQNLTKMVENLAQLEEKLKIMEGDLNKIEEVDDDLDDEEDICLSRLKTTIDSDNIISAPKDPILEELEEIPSSPIPEAESNQKEKDTPLIETSSLDENIHVPPEAEIQQIEKEQNVDIVATKDQMDVDKILENKNVDLSESLLVEDVNKRPQRRKAKTTLKYKNDDDSDEDPFANVELSDDDKPRRGKKSGRYQSDDEYIPGLERNRQSSIDSSDSAVDDTLEELKKQKRKRGKKKLDVETNQASSSPAKIAKTTSFESKSGSWRFSPEVGNLSDNNSIESSTPVIKDVESVKSDQPTNSWGTSKEFENFLAKKIQGTNLKIKKLKSSKISPSVITPLEIPVLNANEIKKKIDTASQTNMVNTATTSAQTTGPGNLSMKTNVPLSSVQSEKACEFLKSIVKTTSELGQLMTQKSEDFIEKKINTDNVVDTFKMDYCVKKSFLLLKLAKHNLMQMEEDLSSQYEKFLKDNDMLSYREQEKKIIPKPKDQESDSDCEIIEETVPTPSTSVKSSNTKPKFNPKTVFLNKELSIKIAKKPTEEVKNNKNLNIKGRHTVWISDSVMVKKVKSQQSFLAQDSRNKKPPDNKITNKMVSDFFEDYYRDRAVQVCAPFVSPKWLYIDKTIACNYFSIEPEKLTSDNISRTDNVFTNTESNVTLNDSGDGIGEKSFCEVSKLRNPTTLFSICLKNLQEHFLMTKLNDTISFPELKDMPLKIVNQPVSLFTLCLSYLTKNEVTNNIFLTLTEKPNFQEENSFLDLEEMNGEQATFEKYSLFQKEDTLQNHIFTPLNEKPNLQEENLLADLKEIKGEQPLLQNEEEPIVLNDTLVQHYKYDLTRKIQSLITLCHQRIAVFFCVTDTNVQESYHVNTDMTDDTPQYIQSTNYCSLDNVKSLHTICVEIIQNYLKKMTVPSVTNNSCKRHSYSLSLGEPNSLKQIAFEHLKCLLNNNNSPQMFTNLTHNESDKSLNKVKTLKMLCFDIVSKFNGLLNFRETKNEADEANLSHITSKILLNKVETLKKLSFNTVSKSYDKSNFHEAEHDSTLPVVELTNTLSEEAFINIEESSTNYHDNSDYFEDDRNTDFEDEMSLNVFSDNAIDSHAESENWASQVQLEGLKSCFLSSNKTKRSSNPVPENEVNNVTAENYPLIAHIKTEPGLEEPPATCNTNILSQAIKSEPTHDLLDQMTIIPESIITKRECAETLDPITVGRNIIQRQNSTSFDEDSFEAFVSANKMIRALDDFGNSNDEMFTQSAYRVRRQHEPDSDNENDTSMSLLVPQTFEPLTIESAKGSLLECSSSDGENAAKKNNKRKTTARRKTKKPEPPKPISKEVPSKEKPAVINEVSILTRRMREKIRQEEKKDESSDTDSEITTQITKKDKESKKPINSVRTPVKKNKSVEGEIQCNNVDSTEQVTSSSTSVTKSDSGQTNKDVNQFTGFSADDQNEISTYHKYVKFVYDQIIPKVNEESQVTNTKETSIEKVTQIDTEKVTKFDTEKITQSDTEKVTHIDNVTKPIPIIDPNESIELLECTPTMPIFDEETQVLPKRKSAKEVKSPNSKKKCKVSKPDTTKEGIEREDAYSDNTKSNTLTEVVTSKTDEDDSKTEPVTMANEKSKEPCSFIERHGWKCYPIQSNETKLYQRAIIPLEKLPESFVETYFEYQGITDKSQDDAEIDRLTNLPSLNRLSSKIKSRRKDKTLTEDRVKSRQNNSERSHSPANSTDYHELTPSEDEGANYDDDFAPSTPIDNSENSIAKNSLMNDEDDSDSPISKHKTPPKEDGDKLDSRKKHKIGPKSKMVDIKQEHSDSLILTADKMLNKELTLLHAPVVLDDEKSQTPLKPVTRNKQRSATKYYGRGGRPKSDDSSSEEEKQWVNTKEKLLKRVGKRQESAMDDDAKRAKLVTDFIEKKRNDKPEIRKTRGRSKRSRRKLLERQKQMRVLSHELFGESTYTGKGNSQAYFKGRRNIRKVIDKKSLARSTVIANMEEFERKRRLNQKQAKLQELMGCDEGVNVVVINDEVCLEYDFAELRPAVSVHPFFTKVMKAHQYEGVKFMWDACFESVEMVEAGKPGGGCILAHCMGLGKTLQVLALLHTVLTHPRVGMHRVLVCCPLSTVLNWVDEIHKWIGPVTDQIKVFELSKLKKTYERAYQLEDWYNGGGIFIIGYELFRSLTTLDAELDNIRQTIIDKIRSALLDPGPDIVICDEGHLLKNDSSVLAVAMSRVATRRRIVLTGTPIQNNLREYYCMVNFVKPNLLGTYAEYSNRFENPIMNGQHRDSQQEDIKLMKARTHILHKVLEGCLQRQEASVLYPYLPKKHEYTVFISLTKCQCDLYKHYLKDYANKQKQSILKDFHTLQKIWSHPQVLHNFQMKSRDEKVKLKEEKLEDDLACEDLAATEDMKPSSTEVWWLQYLEGGNMLEVLESSNKFVAVFRILEECVALGDKVLIFSTSLITMDALEYFLKKMNNWALGQEYYRLDGSVPPEVRQKWVREFNADHNLKTKLFLISTRAGSLGLNMTAANRVIILDTSWNPAHDIQSIFRVYRFGQKKDCFIYRLVALGTMEQKIYERSVTKQAVSCRVVDEQQIDRHYNMAELTELYRFDETGVGVAGGVAVGVQDVVLLRVARDAALHAVHEHDSLLRGSEPALPEHERAAAWHQFQQETRDDRQYTHHTHEHGSLLRGSEPALPEHERAAAWHQFQQETRGDRQYTHHTHEHGSLLRGSEPALPEHERAAAWHQFQQETRGDRQYTHHTHEHGSLLRGSEPALPEHERAAAWHQFQQETRGDRQYTHHTHEHGSLLRGSEPALPEHERAAAWHQFQQETRGDRQYTHHTHEHGSLLRGSEPALPEHERAAAWHQFQQETRDDRQYTHHTHEHGSLLRGSEPALPEHERAAAWHQFQQETRDDRQYTHHTHEHGSLLRGSEPALPEHERAAAWHQFQQETRGDRQYTHHTHEHGSLLRGSEPALPEHERAAAWHQFQQETRGDRQYTHHTHEHGSLLRGSEPALPEHERAAAWHQFQQETRGDRQYTHHTHEHGSLLRGSEPALPEHERAAAWHQFQQETRGDQMKTDEELIKNKKIAKRSLSVDKTVEVKPEIKEEITIEEVKITPPAEPKAKRGKKGIACCIPIQAEPQPSSSSQDDFLIDKNQENDMVSKITQILLSHDFNNKVKTGSKDIAKLIGTVRQFVASGDLSSLPPGDELAASIAKVLLRKEASPMPALTDVRSLATPSHPAKETEHPTSDDTSTKATDEPSVKTRRRAALSAEKKLYTIAPDIIIDLNDGDWIESPTPQVPKPVKDTEKPKYKPGPKSKKKPAKPQKEPEPPPVDDSIVLSDDDVTPEPPTVVKQEAAEKSKASDEEIWPLHPSLLTNQNFVKIVAHTYLAGNPMLDEDAATLAARYSTGKALRELEDTGKSITSGPIYDIAVKVLGMDILRKLHTSGVNSPTPSKAKEKKALSDTDKVLSAATADERPRLKVKVTSDLMPKEKAKETPKIPNLGLVKLTPVAPVLAAPVVPVGLIKRAAPAPSPAPPAASGDECILPDDDDVRLVAPAPAAPPAPAPAPAPPAPSGRPVITLCGNRILAVGAGIAPEQLPAPEDTGTICLDSDEDDTTELPPVRNKTQAPKPPPVPVAIAAATPARPSNPTPPPSKRTSLLRRNNPPEPASTPAAPPPVTFAPRNVAPTPTAPEPTASKTLPSKKEPSKVCKVGDIIRISKSGQVEILNKLEASKLGLISNQSTNTAATAQPETKGVPKGPERIRASSSSSSASSRSDSPNDPLSILRDVVHIPADRYQNSQGRGESNATPSPSKQTKTASKTSETYTHTPKKLAVTNTNHVIPNEPLKITKLASCPNSKLSKNLTVTKTTSVNRTGRSVVESVDLTDAPAPSAPPKSVASAKNYTPPTRSKKEPAPSAPKNVTVLTGSSKNIILTPSNTLKGGVARVSNLEPRDGKKRPAVKVEAETTKRKRSEPMTLKDFDIDDIDDIIELE